MIALNEADRQALKAHYNMLGSLFDGDYLQAVISATDAQEASILAMRDTLGFVLGLEPDSTNIKRNLERLAELAEKVNRGKV
jgi:hypothetical protein